MTRDSKIADITELKPRITVFGVGGAGGNAVNNMIESGLDGVDFVVANTDAQALALSKADKVIQMGLGVTEGLGAGSHPEVGRAAAEETLDEINAHLDGVHMAFITAGMGGGTGTGAAPVVARAARERGILTVGVVTKPFQFEGKRRMSLADGGIDELHRHVDTLIVIPNQNLFRVANEKTTFADAFGMADEVLHSGVACVTDLMVKEGLINLDFADVRAVMRGMGKAMMGTGEAEGENRAQLAAEAAIANPLLDDVSMRGAKGLLISITGGLDLTLYEVDEAASRIREEVDEDANIILGATFDSNLEGRIRVSVVATGTDSALVQAIEPVEDEIAEMPASRMQAAPSIAEQQPTEAPTPVQMRAPEVAPLTPMEPAKSEPMTEAQLDTIGADLAQGIRQSLDRREQAGSTSNQAMKADLPDDITIKPLVASDVLPRSPKADAPAQAPNDAAPVAEAPAERTISKPLKLEPADFPELVRHQLEPGTQRVEQTTARSLLRRLASNVGLKNPGEESGEQGAEGDAQNITAQPAQSVNTHQNRRTERGDLDKTGRTSVKKTVSASTSSEEIEIPAFLKKSG